MRKNFQTTVEEELIKSLKIEAIKQDLNVNEILEYLIKMFLKGEIKLK